MRPKKGPSLFVVVCACVTPLAVTLLFITWTQSLLLQLETENPHPAAAAAAAVVRSNNNNNNNNNNNGPIDVVNQVLKEQQKQLQNILQKPVDNVRVAALGERPPAADNNENNLNNNHNGARLVAPQQPPAAQVATQAPTQAPAQRPPAAPEKPTMPPRSATMKEDDLTGEELAAIVDFRLKNKFSKHTYKGDSPEVLNQPAHCKQRKGRDYNVHPIMYITPNGNGQLERMDCPVPCTFTSDRSKWAEADGAMYVIPGDSGPAPPKVCPLQKSVLFSMECEAIYPILSFAVGYKQWDILGTTRLESDVPLIYGSYAEYGFHEPISPKTASGLAVAAISNCGALNNRLEVLQELMDHGVSVHSYGRCKHNYERQGPSGGWFKDKVDMLRPYKFVLAFENSNVDDYISEKFFQAFVAGTVPVYMGAPNAHQFRPGDKSIIKVTDFPNTKALADYLLYLDKHDDEYNKYLAWKTEGLSPNFKRVMNESSYHSNCRLCMRMKQIFDAELEGIPD